MLSLTKAGRNLTRSQIDGLPYTGLYLPSGKKKIDCKRKAMKAKRNGDSPSPKTTLPFQVGAVEEQKKSRPSIAEKSSRMAETWNMQGISKERRAFIPSLNAWLRQQRQQRGNKCSVLRREGAPHLPPRTTVMKQPDDSITPRLRYPTQKPAKLAG